MEWLDHIDTHILQLFTSEQAWHYQAIPFQWKDGFLWLAADDAQLTDTAWQDELTLLLGAELRFQPTNRSELHPYLSRYYRRQDRTQTAATQFSLQQSDSIAQLIAEAKSLNSSDIHIEIYEKRCRVRMRIDGVLIEKYILDKTDYPSLVNKIKIKAQLDIAEKRLPQDGRIFFEENGQKLDIRVSVLPTLHGEKIVLRLLSNNTNQLDIYKSGFDELDLERYIEGVRQPQGMVLISGPTGSGKTTTLYSTLRLLHKTTHNILTIEDPIEYTLEGINQVQLREAIGLDFAAALRTFLRQDPDIIMVGEIRDKDTAEMAIRTSLTGHLVLSTIHTNSAWGIVARLVDMGVPAYLLADTLNMAVAQRLVRVLCPHCKEEQPFQANLLPKRYKLPFAPATHFIAKGCDHCYFTGYKGRKAIYEVIPIDSELADAIKSEQFKVQHLLDERQIKSLAANAFALWVKGETSADEIYPILASY